MTDKKLASNNAEKQVPDALQTVINQHAITLAEQQYRLANLFTPYGFDPEQVDFERVATFMDDPKRAFPDPSDGILASLDRISQYATTARVTLEAFAAQGFEPSLTSDQLFVTAKGNVTQPRNRRIAA